MDFSKVSDYLNQMIETNELANAQLVIRINGNIMFSYLNGYCDIKNRIRIRKDSVYRMMSNSKVVTAVGVLKLIEQGKISLDDDLSKYIPEFKNRLIVDDEKYKFSPKMSKFTLIKNLLFFNFDKVNTTKAKREIKIRDLLSHSSGLEQGLFGLYCIKKHKFLRSSPKQVALEYSKYPLDFNPGEGTGYSPLAGFDLLVRVIEIASETDAATYFKKEIFEPLEMNNSTFSRSKANNLVNLYKKKKGKLIDVTSSKEDMQEMFIETDSYVCGSGGLYSTLEDYEHLANMLRQYGNYNGREILHKETVELMTKEGSYNHLEPEPGMVWGLGVKIRTDPEKGKYISHQGTYGWSGAYGTHMFVSPKDDMDVVFMTNRQDAGGSGFEISKKIEEMIFEIVEGEIK